MNIYIGNYWVPFPSSEYGGTWAVVANNEEECVQLLKDHTTYQEEYYDLIPNAVRLAYTFKIMYNSHPHVVDAFFT